MQREDRALCGQEVAFALDPFGEPGELAHRLRHRSLSLRLDHIEKAAANHIERAGQ